MTKKDPLGYKEFVKRVSRGHPPLVCVFTGTQERLFAEAIDLLKSEVVGSNTSLDYAIFRGDEASAREIIDAALTFPMLSQKRLCVVKDAQGLGTQGLKLLEDYFEAPSPRTCLVLTFGGGYKPNLKLTSQVVLVDFSLATDELSEILTTEAKRLGVEITPQAARLLLHYVGEDIGIALSELEKLSLCIEKGDKIREEYVERLTERTNYDGVFELLSAVFSKNKKDALRCLLELEARAEDPISILNTLTWRVRLICRVRELMEKNSSQGEIAQALSVSPRAVYYLREQAKRFNSRELSKIVEKLYSTDRRLKSSSVSPRYVLAHLVLEICS